MFVNFISIIQNLKNTLSNYEKFILETEEYLHSHNGRIIEDLTAMEVGTTVIRVRKKNNGRMKPIMDPMNLYRIFSNNDYQ